MRRFAEDGVHLGLVSHLEKKADVAGRLLPHLGRAGPGGLGGRRDGGHDIVIDLDEVGGVLGGGVGLGYDGGDGLADVVHAVDGEGAVGRLEVGGAVGSPALDPRGEGAEAVGQRVGAGQHRQHAGGARRGIGADRADAGGGVGRAQDIQVRLARERQVVGVTALAAQQPPVLDPGDGISHPELTHMSPPSPRSSPAAAGLRLEAAPR